jgi:hypothetical protein
VELGAAMKLFAKQGMSKVAQLNLVWLEMPAAYTRLQPRLFNTRATCVILM